MNTFKAFYEDRLRHAEQHATLAYKDMLAIVGDVEYYVTTGGDAQCSVAHAKKSFRVRVSRWLRCLDRVGACKKALDTWTLMHEEEA